MGGLGWLILREGHGIATQGRWRGEGGALGQATNLPLPLPETNPTMMTYAKCKTSGYKALGDQRHCVRRIPIEPHTQQRPLIICSGVYTSHMLQAHSRGRSSRGSFARQSNCSHTWHNEGGRSDAGELTSRASRVRMGSSREGTVHTAGGV